MNSPLKPPITSSKSLATIKKLIPEGSVVHSFLFYDGNIEVQLSDSKRFVIAHTNKYVNYEFWQCLMNDPERVAIIADHFGPIESENIFDILQKEWLKYSDPFIRSGIYYLLNQSSDLGYITSGKLIEGLDLKRNILKMKSFKTENLHVQLDTEEDFLDSIAAIDSRCDFVFLPVRSFSFNFLEEGKNIGFEQTTVIHKKLKDLIEKTDKKVILLYDYSKQLDKLYKDYNIKIIYQWGRDTNVHKFAKEMLVANF